MLAANRVVVNPLTQTCEACSRICAAGDGLAFGNDWYCRQCWEKWHEQEQTSKLLDQMPHLDELTKPMASAAAIDAARLTVCKLMGRPESTTVDLSTEENGGKLPAFVLLTGQGFRAMRDGQSTLAQWCFEQAVMLRPLDVEATYHLASFFDVSHRGGETAVWVERVLELDPSHHGAQLLRAMAAERHRDNERAMRLYKQAMDSGGGRQAQDRFVEIMADMRVCLEAAPAWRDALSRVLREDRRWFESFPSWQENFYHPKAPAGECERAGRAWDDVFGEPLLSMLEETAEQMQLFWQTNGLLAPEGSSVTVWYPWTERAPKLAAELAIRLIAPLLGEDPNDFSGVEWWGKSRTGNRGQNLHYDESEGDGPGMRCTTCGRLHAEEWLDGKHNPWRPKYICVLYLSDGGGPSFAVEQVYRKTSHHNPIVPQRGLFVMPKRGRLVVWRGDLKHGNMAADPTETSLRKIVVFDLWQSHRPPPKHCTDVDFSRCLGVQKLLKEPKELEVARVAEIGRGGVLSANPVPFTVLSAPDDLPWSTRMGFWDFSMPMPSLEQLRNGSGAYQVDWRAAAERFARGDLAGVRTVPHGPDVQGRSSAAPLLFETVD